MWSRSRHTAESIPYCSYSIFKNCKSTVQIVQKMCPDLDHIQKCTKGFRTEMIPRSTESVYKSKIFRVDVNDHDLCCMRTSHNCAQIRSLPP